MSLREKFISDSELTEEAFIKKYTTGISSIGTTEEIKHYLRLRHQYYNNKLSSYQPVMEAYNKTNLPNTNHLSCS